MIGFITSIQTATAINDAVSNAQTSRGLPVYWLPGHYPIYTGGHAGQAFIPLDDTMLSTVLHKGMRPVDFPEFDQLVALLGGLSARVEIDSVCITDPNVSPP